MATHTPVLPRGSEKNGEALETPQQLQQNCGLVVKDELLHGRVLALQLPAVEDEFSHGWHLALQLPVDKGGDRSKC